MFSRITRLARVIGYAVLATAAIVTGIWIAKKYVVRERVVWTKNIAAGTAFPQDLHWQKGSNTLVLALKQDCPFCSESMNFYRRLISRSAEAQVRVIVLMPEEPSAARRYLSDAGVEVSEVKQVQLRSLGIQGTPTVYLVDGAGTIQREWRGRLTGVKEQEVLDLLANNFQPK